MYNYDNESIDSYILQELRIIEHSDCKIMPSIKQMIADVQGQIDQIRVYNWTKADYIAKMLTDAVTQ